MSDQIVKTITSPKGKERIVVFRHGGGTYSYYRQCVWNRHKAGTSEFFLDRTDDGVWALPGPNCGLFASASLAEQDALVGLSWPGDAELPAGGLDGDDRKTISDIAELAEQVLQSVAPTAFVQAQEWDNRIDCSVKLPNGSVIGEMVSLQHATEARIRDAGVRLQQRLQGIDVPLENKLLPPILIRRGGDVGPNEGDPTKLAAALATLPPALKAVFEMVIEQTSARKGQPK